MSNDTSAPEATPEGAPKPVRKKPKIDVNIRNEFTEMNINGSVVPLNQSNRVSLVLEGSQEEVEQALNDLLKNLPSEWQGLQAATSMVIQQPLVDEFGRDGANPIFVLSVSCRQVLTRNDEVESDQMVEEIDDNLEIEEG